MRTLKAALIASTSLTALLLAGCASTYTHEGRDVPSAAYTDSRHSPRTKAPVAVHTSRKRVVPLAAAIPARPAVATPKISVSEPPSVRIADPVTKPVVRADVAKSVPVAVTPEFVKSAPAVAMTPNVVEAPKSVAVPTLPPVATIEATIEPTKPDPVAIPQARAAAAPSQPKAAATKAPDVSTAVEAVKVPVPTASEPKTTDTKLVEVRPLSQARQAPAPITIPATIPATISAPATPQVQAASPSQGAVTPTPQHVAPTQTPLIQASPAGPPAAPMRQSALQPAPVQAAPIASQPRANEVITRAADYMAANRIVNARALLEDQAKSGDPAILKALAETYDPLHLRDVYPRLARAGDLAKAMAAYEKAVAAGANGLAPRIDALRALIAARQ